MTQTEYENKKRECWEEFCIKNPAFNDMLGRKIFNQIYDRAYALGKKATELSSNSEQLNEEGEDELLTELQKKVQKLYSDYCTERDNEEKGSVNRFCLSARIAMLITLFGHHNLTSDAEGEEEMLYVNRKQIDALQDEIFKAIMDAHDADDWQDAAHYILDVMPRSFAALFGSKCLSDENSSNVEKLEKNDEDYNVDSSEQKAAGPKFKVEDEVVWDKRIIAYVDEILNDGDYIIYSRVGNRYTVHESDLEPYTEQEENPIPSNLTELNSKEADKHFDNILKDSFSKERRLNIAVQLTCAMIPKYQDNGDGHGLSVLNEKDMIKCAYRLADILIAEAEKGGDNENN